MELKKHHFLVGKLECIIVNDGTLTYTEPAQAHFANAPSDQLAQALRKYNIELDQWHEWISPLPCLVVKTGKHTVMVDTGLGNVDFGPNAGRLLENLKDEGIQPEEIDTVILTHAHGDHVGWNTDSNGLAVFPHARYFMRQEEWDFWTSETTLAQPEYAWMAGFIQKQILPLTDHIELLDQDTEIVPGVQSIFAPGHTPGHMAVEIASSGEKLLCLGDIVTHPIHLERPEWHIAPDCQPDEAVCTRKKLLEHAATEQACVFAFHFDFPGLGYVHPHQGAWQWYRKTSGV